MARISDYIFFKPDTRYAYAVGRIRALESRQLTREDIERMIEAKQPEEALRIIVEGGYKEEGLKPGTWSELESLIKIQQQRALNLLSELSQDASISGLFSERYDFHNLKVLFKGRYSHQNLDHLLIEMGTIAIDLLEKAITEENYKAVPQFIQDTAEAVASVWERTLAPQLIDITVDNQMYTRFVSVLKPFGNSFLSGWLTLEIDLMNIGALLRLKWLDSEADLFDRALIDGGSTNKAQLLSIREEPWEGVVEAFSRTPYAEVVAKGVDHILSSNSFVQLESLKDRLTISYLRRARFQPLGIEPVIAYLLLKEYEFKAVRVVVVGKSNGLPDNIIKERLPVSAD